jgi:hypothetical protein
MEKLRELFTTYGLVGTLGVFLILAACIPLLGVSPFDLKELATLPPAKLVGLAFLGIGLVLMAWRVAQRRDETTVSDTDARLLREVILPPLNRQAILECHADNEDLRAQFSGITEARIALQQSQTHLDSTALRSLVGILIELTKDMESFSPWRPEVGIKAYRSGGGNDQQEFDEWCIERFRKGAKVPIAPTGGTSYGVMLNLLQDKLYPVRVIKLELEHISLVHNS